MTQKHITSPAPLRRCAAGHSARLMLDMRSPAAGGGHFVECCCRYTARHTEADAAVAEWQRMNRPARSARKPAAGAVEALADNVVQIPLRLASPAYQPGKGVQRVRG